MKFAEENLLSQILRSGDWRTLSRWHSSCLCLLQLCAPPQDPCFLPYDGITRQKVPRDNEVMIKPMLLPAARHPGLSSPSGSWQKTEDSTNSTRDPFSYQYGELSPLLVSFGLCYSALRAKGLMGESVLSISLELYQPRVQPIVPHAFWTVCFM